MGVKISKNMAWRASSSSSSSSSSKAMSYLGQTSTRPTD